MTGAQITAKRRGIVWPPPTHNPVVSLVHRPILPQSILLRETTTCLEHTSQSSTSCILHFFNQHCVCHTTRLTVSRYNVIYEIQCKNDAICGGRINVIHRHAGSHAEKHTRGMHVILSMACIVYCSKHFNCLVWLFRYVQVRQKNKPKILHKFYSKMDSYSQNIN